MDFDFAKGLGDIIGSILNHFSPVSRSPSGPGSSRGGMVLGLVAGLLMFGGASIASLVFGFVTYPDWKLALIPAPAVAILGGASGRSSRWQDGFVAGLALWCVGLTIAVGPLAVPFYVLPVVAAWRLGRVVAGRRAARMLPAAPFGSSGTSDRGPRFVISGVAAAAILGVVVWYLARPPAPPFEPNPATLGLSAVAAGQCFDDVLADAVSLGVQILSCAVPHQYQMIHAAAYPAASDAPFPAGTELEAYADRLCRQAFTDYVGIAPDRSELTFSYLMPGEESWSSSDDRWIACLVGERPPAPPLLGSVRGTKK